MCSTVTSAASNAEGRSVPALLADDRVRNPRLLKRRVVLKRLLVRLAGSLCLLIVSTPGLLLWLPILFMAKRGTDRLIRNGPVFECAPSGIFVSRV